MVAGDLDPATERIISYLAGVNVPINVVFFRYFNDDGRAHLARTWLLDENLSTAKGAVKRRAGSKEVWNEQDWYVSFGEEPTGRSWDDARRYGFVSAGGAEWFSKTLKKLPIGARVFACIPKTGYVGIGTVAGTADRFKTAAYVFAQENSGLGRTLRRPDSMRTDVRPARRNVKFAFSCTRLRSAPRNCATEGMFPSRTSMRSAGRRARCFNS